MCVNEKEIFVLNTSDVFLCFQHCILFFIMCICVSEYGCVHIHIGVHGGQKRVLDLMELELKVVMSYKPSV